MPNKSLGSLLLLALSLLGSSLPLVVVAREVRYFRERVTSE
jgi:hypothetical protein